MKLGCSLPHKSYYPLNEAATLAGCMASDLVHYGVQNKISLLFGVPDGVSLRVYDENSRELSEPFILTPQLLSLSSGQCLKIELQGRTQSSDFLSGYLLGPDGGLKKLFPNYGRRDLNHPWVFWRLFESDNVCLLELSPDRLFVTREDLLALTGEGGGPSAQPPERKEKKPRASSDWNADGPVRGSGDGPDIEAVDQVAGRQDESVIAERPKPLTAEVKKSVAPVEVVDKPSPKGPAILRLKHVIERTGLSRSTIYDRINPNSPRFDPNFPKQVSLGGDAVGWIEAEIDAWIQSRKNFPNR